MNEGLHVAVVGANGHLGGKILRRLAADGHVVTAVGRRPPEPLPEGARFAEADALDPVALERALSGARVVIDNVSAFRAGGFPRPKARAIARDAHAHLAAAAAAVGAEAGVVISVLGADRVDPSVRHFHEKTEAERAWSESGLRTLSLRPGMFLDQEDGRIEKALDAGRFDHIGRSDVPFGAVWTDTVVQVLAQALRSNQLEGAVEVVEGNFTAEELAAWLARARGHEVKVRAVPWAVFSALTALPRLFSPGLRNLHAMMRFIGSGGYAARAPAALRST